MVERVILILDIQYKRLIEIIESKENKVKISKSITVNSEIYHKKN